MKFQLNFMIMVFQVFGDYCTENIDYYATNPNPNAYPQNQKCKSGWSGEGCCQSSGYKISLGAVIGIIISIILLIILFILCKCRHKIRRKCCPPLIQHHQQEQKPNPQPQPQPSPQKPKPKKKKKKKKKIAPLQENSQNQQQQTDYIMTTQTMRINIDQERILRIQRQQIFRIEHGD